MQDFWHHELISSEFLSIDLSQLAGLILVILVLILGYRKVRDYLTMGKRRYHITDARLSKISVMMKIIAVITIGIGILLILKIDPVLEGQYDLTLTNILFAILVILFARIADIIILSRIDQAIKLRKDPAEKRHIIENSGRGAHIVQMIIIFISAYILLNHFDFLNLSLQTPLKNGNLIIRLSHIAAAFTIFYSARFVVWLLTNFFLQGFYHRRKIDIGKQYAYNQLFSYLLYFFAIILALHTMGIQMTLIWGGAAALLVGIGIALQQSINDLFSGIVLLFESSIQVGDYLELHDGRSGMLVSIGLRSSLIETRDNMNVVIPNSKLVHDPVVNWSHLHHATRFDIHLGVAYGSDTRLVEQLLIQSVKVENRIIESPSPFVRLLDFGDNALHFGLYFYTFEYLRVEDIKSNLRKRIDLLFRENNITIPFPQRDIWIKKEE